MEECVLFWRSWAQARQQSRCRARETDVVFNCGDCTSDMMTRKLSQVHFEQARLQVLQMPEFHQHHQRAGGTGHALTFSG